MADRLALIIANSDFKDPKWPRLKAPTRDAEALADVLGNPEIGNFDTTLLAINEGVVKIRQKIEWLYDHRKRSDLLLFYYSGHGYRDPYGDLYLLAQDTQTESLSATALSASFVRERLNKSGSRRMVVVLDCCHSGAFAKTGLGDSVGTKDAFAGNGYGRVILTASDAMELSWEGDECLGEDRLSLFTNFLVEGLRTGAADLDGNGKITLDELYEYVHEQVMTSRCAKQTPHKWDQEVKGQIIIASSSVSIAECHPSISPDQGLAPTLQEMWVSLLGQTIRSATGLVPTWCWLACSLVLMIFVVSLFIQRLGARSEFGSTISPTGTLSAAIAQEPAETLTVEPSPSTLPPRPTATSTPMPSATHTSKPSPTHIPDVPLRNASLGDTWTRPADGAVMVYVPSGTFRMGSDDDDVDNALQLCKEYHYNCERSWVEDEQPMHSVTLDEFWLDRTEVTNAQYALCVADGDCEESSYMDDTDFNGDNYPVVGVSWHDANSYCEWAGSRLPTEAEWEYAARGLREHTYPWGDGDPSCGLAQYSDCSGSTVPVGSFPNGASWCGVLDMAGNVWEWVDDWYGKYHSGSQTNPTGPEMGKYRVLRGGSWYDGAGSARAANRYWYVPRAVSSDYGFRCARERTHLRLSDWINRIYRIVFN